MRVWLVAVGEPIPVGEAVYDNLHRAGQFAHYLAEHGHDVTWWTSTFDHFRKKHVFDQDTELQPTEHLRIKLLHGSGYRSNISYSRIKDQRIVSAKFARQAVEETHRPDVIVASLPVIELCEESVKYGRRRGVPVVLDMRDMWPDICVDMAPAPARPIAKLLLSPMFAQARRACAGATAIIGITDAFVDWGLRRAGRPKADLDRSFPFAKSSSPLDPDQIRAAEQFWDGLGITADSDEFVMCFFGAIGRVFDLESPIEAARILESKGRGPRLVICGTGDKLRDYKSLAEGVEGIMFPGWMNAAQIRVLMKRSSVGLDPMPDRYDFVATINNKALEYMSAGLPVVSCPKQGVLYELLKTENCGVGYANGDSSELAAVLSKLMDDKGWLSEMAANSARLFENEFTAENVHARMMAYLSEVSTSEDRLKEVVNG